MSAAHSSAPRALVVWRFCDGRAGHREQSLGLCEALERLTPLRVVDVPVPRRRGARAAGPRPDLLVGAGHRTHLPLLAARRRHGGHAVVLMRPTLPLRLFDSAIVPEHDRPPQRPDVLATIGVLNRVRPGQARPEQALVLVGGPSPHFRWDEERVAESVRRLVARDPERHWQLADSPRTPPTTSARLAQVAGTRFVHHADCPAGWLRTALASAGVCWLTPDSVSMLCEALSAGAAVGVLPLEPRRRSRVAHFVAGLVDSGRVCGWDAWLDGRQPSPGPVLNEAERAARWLLRRVAPERLAR